ncbi:hypothetical protein RRG08_014823 [Elysia crispata]|uniref:Uncharacterized protein n=1 Tax=Elysia crispata TaxID=231223 RepID=A0AAE0Z8L5_9GAST|nr:hypothetical protein RRG08_014823 [Elysia crispata]
MQTTVYGPTPGGEERDIFAQCPPIQMRGHSFTQTDQHNFSNKVRAVYEGPEGQRSAHIESDASKMPVRLVLRQLFRCLLDTPSNEESSSRGIEPPATDRCLDLPAWSIYRLHSLGERGHVTQCHVLITFYHGVNQENSGSALT